MTRQRDLKQRIRDRMQETGESYMTARRHVLAQREAPEATIDVVEPTDATEAAARLGFACRVVIFPRLAAALAQDVILARLRDALLVQDRELGLLRDAAFAGRMAVQTRMWLRDAARDLRFIERARAGIGGISASGLALAMHVEGVPVLCTAWRLHASRTPQLVLGTLEDGGPHTALPRAALELWGR